MQMAAIEPIYYALTTLWKQVTATSINTSLEIGIYLVMVLKSFLSQATVRMEYGL